MGLSPAICALVCSAASRGIDFSRIPESIGPGLTALTRILRGSSSRARLRVIERSAALPAAYALSIGSPSTFATDVVSTTPLPSASSGASFCTVK